MLYDVKTLPNTPISPFVLPKQSLYNKVKKEHKGTWSFTRRDWGKFQGKYHFRRALDPIGLNPPGHLMKFTQPSIPYRFGFEPWL